MFNNKSIAIIFIAAIALALVGGANANGIGLHLTEQAVADTLYRYGTDLNALVEYGINSACSASSVNPAVFPAAAAFVATYFSQNVKSYVVVQQTVAAPPSTVLNWTVGAPGFANSAALFQTLQVSYAEFMYYFSAPFWWTIDKPYVTALNVRDSAYGGATTAYITASDVNTGFFCLGAGTSSPTRGFRQQQSVYHHVLVLEGDENSATWRFLEFEETNKNMINYPQLPTQISPTPAV